MSDSIKDCYEFDPFRVDRVKRRLLRHGAIVPLTPKAFETLLVLIEHRGQVVEKTELMERVWPGVAVEENNLTQNISALRKALGEKREEPRYILTAPGIGYRFIAPVHERSIEAQPSLTSGLATDEPDYHSIRNSAVSEPLLNPRNNWRRLTTIITTALIVVVGLATVTYRVVRRARGAEATARPAAQIKSIA
ncbi:MAG TPA: transcriptional regulator, partial [Pyrinomonadaceae bacterium]|nr:transcriptional regulator [Pyrinomonadaceae bacterium]